MTVPSAPSDPVPAVVLDTNVVLDWLVFRHPTSVALTAALADGRLRWLASPAMREELAHVLGRGVGAAWSPDQAALWATWERWACAADPLAAHGAATRLRCTDADDQKFIDLALAHGARWLLSRDRAVLKLARRARPLGLEVLTPEAWRAAFSDG
ncbi:MAG TPA: PIN domain-containing protein [Albitalea sp.]|uniref:PIN domain-containing protein n=1 Tax=Piscinibacter sp. TaxID=1903157 RepID=UPI002ED28DD0